MSEPTPLQRETWEAYFVAGSARAAARVLGVHEITVRNRLAALRDVYGVRTNVQLAAAIEREKLAA